MRSTDQSEQLDRKHVFFRIDFHQLRISIDYWEVFDKTHELSSDVSATYNHHLHTLNHTSWTDSSVSGYRLDQGWDESDCLAHRRIRETRLDSLLSVFSSIIFLRTKYICTGDIWLPAVSSGWCIGIHHIRIWSFVYRPTESIEMQSRWADTENNRRTDLYWSKPTKAVSVHHSEESSCRNLLIVDTARERERQAGKTKQDN